MKFYRICTENKNKEAVVRLVDEYFFGFTVIEGLGYWEGKPENSLIIEVMTESDASRDVRRLAAEIRNLNEQQCVLVQSYEVNADFI